ncbi:MAG: response regulator [Candidatus Sulfotelmatobacter sp.]
MSNPADKTILCIDDDRSALDYHRALLERSGYLVLTASSARRGVEIARTCAISLVLVDYHMPEMTGDEVANTIKRVKPTVPVIIVSSDDEIRKAALGQADGFVLKDEVINLLVPTVVSFCGENPGGLHEGAIAGD